MGCYTLNLDLFYLFKVTFKFNFLFISLMFLVSNSIFYYTGIEPTPKLKQDSIFNLIKIVNFYSIILSFFIHIISFFIFIVLLYNNNLFVTNSMFFVGLDSLDFYSYNDGIFTEKDDVLDFFSKFIPQGAIDFFGMVIITLAYIIGFLSIFLLDNRLYWKNIKYIFYFNFFIFTVYMLVSASSILTFFLYYEMLLIPSFLVVYFLSPNRRTINASFYFIIWTQLGSILVLIALYYIIYITNSYDFYKLHYYNFTKTESTIIIFLLFFGFGFKIPIWPFNYWLIRTHVEAPSGFSIFLSGFLVKTALYGFYKFNIYIFSDLSTKIFIIICLFGVIDSTLKMWGQTDLKKLVAYGTIQEMNIIFLTFCLGDSYAIVGGVLFCITHAFLSTLMFFIVDIIYKRYKSRSIIEVNGIFSINPNLSLSIIFMLIAFYGIPGTLKFSCEFYIFNGFLELSPILSFILIFTVNVLGCIGFSKPWFNVIFGLPKKNSKYLQIGLTLKELFVIIFCFFFLIIIPYLFFLFF